VGRVVAKNFPARQPCRTKTPDLAIKSEQGSEHIAAEISFVLSPKMIARANCHHAARRTLNRPYLARQLSDGEIWTAYGGVNPCGLVVRWGEV
jgi:hypothetical protein